MENPDKWNHISNDIYVQERFLDYWECITEDIEPENVSQLKAPSKGFYLEGHAQGIRDYKAYLRSITDG